MKRIFSLLAGISMACAAMATRMAEPAPFDSLSYALGHEFSLAVLAVQDPLMCDKSDFEEYIRALDENLRHMETFSDPSYAMTYALGSMQGAFFTDGKNRDVLKAMLPCFISGLRKVACGEIVLPYDTIRAHAIIRQFPSEPDSTGLTAADSCAFYTAFGILKAFPVGLQEYADEMLFPRKIEVVAEAYAEGMADVLEAMATEPLSASDLALFVAVGFKKDCLLLPNLDKASFMTGAKAALQLVEPLMSQEEAQRLMDEKFAEAMGSMESEDDEVIEEMPVGPDDVSADPD